MAVAIEHDNQTVLSKLKEIISLMGFQKTLCILQGVFFMNNEELRIMANFLLWQKVFIKFEKLKA